MYVLRDDCWGAKAPLLYRQSNKLIIDSARTSNLQDSLAKCIVIDRVVLIFSSFENGKVCEPAPVQTRETLVGAGLVGRGVDNLRQIICPFSCPRRTPHAQLR